MKREGKTTEKMDRRTQYTLQVIRDTVLDLMKSKEFSKITVTEICKIADINRGTFYLHYYDTYDVLNEILDEMLSGTTGIIEHILSDSIKNVDGDVGKALSACEETDAKASACMKNCSYPFCERIHSEDRFRQIFLDDSISSLLIEKIADSYKERYVSWLMSHSLLTFEEAEAILYFQINGCLAINKLSLRNHSYDWRKTQRTIDQFIKSGLESFLVRECD